MRNDAILSLALLAFASLAGCRAARGPAGSWKTYRPNLVVAKSSEQGPWGGERWIVWRAPEAGTFTFEARATAESHGWKLLSNDHYDPTPARIADHPTSNEPEFLATPCTIGRFDSRWMREDPGTNEMSPAFGYVQVSDDGREMCVHHFWGNGQVTNVSASDTTP